MAPSTRQIRCCGCSGGAGSKSCLRPARVSVAAWQDSELGVKGVTPGERSGRFQVCRRPEGPVLGAEGEEQVTSASTGERWKLSMKEGV